VPWRQTLKPLPNKIDASAGNWSNWPCASDKRLATFWPRQKPVSLRPAWNAAVSGAKRLGRCKAEKSDHRHRRTAAHVQGAIRRRTCRWEEPEGSRKAQPSCDDTSRMMREYHVRICEGLGVKFPGSTRQSRHIHGSARLPLLIQSQTYRRVAISDAMGHHWSRTCI